MKRLLATINCDFKLQFRNGLLHATAFVVVVVAFGMSRLGRTGLTLDLRWLLPPIMLDLLVISAFYFVGALVLFEKGERSLQAQVITPLRTWEYLLSKVLTLATLATAQNVAIGALIDGVSTRLLALGLGTLLGSAMYTLAGLVAVARYDSINEYLLPSMVYVAALLAPLLAYAGGWNSALIYLHPLHAPLTLMRAAVERIDGWELSYGLGYSALWIALFYAWSERAFRRFVVRDGNA